MIYNNAVAAISWFIKSISICNVGRNRCYILSKHILFMIYYDIHICQIIFTFHTFYWVILSYLKHILSCIQLFWLCAPIGITLYYWEIQNNPFRCYMLEPGHIYLFIVLFYCFDLLSIMLKHTRYILKL